MAEQYHAGECYWREAEQAPGQEETHGQGFVMHHVVAKCAKWFVNQHGEHTQIGREEENREDPPGVWQLREKIDG